MVNHASEQGQCVRPAPAELGGDTGKLVLFDDSPALRRSGRAKAVIAECRRELGNE